MAMHKKSFNVDVDEKLSDEFSAQVEQRGYTKYRAIEGALRGFMVLSAENQVRLISGNLATGNVNQAKNGPKTLREALKNMVKSSTEGSELPAMIIEIRPTDKQLWNELRLLVEPERRRKKVRG